MAVVFVYGTLKKGFRLPSYLENSKFLGEGYIEGYDMYKIDWYPVIVKGNGNVYGEIYEVDDEILKNLDAVEDEGILYKRIKEKVKIKEKELEAFVYVYLEDIEGLEKIKTGKFDL